MHTHPVRLFAILFLLAVSVIAHSQKQNNTWIFGNYAGVNFNSISPVAIAGSAMMASEGCASISDDNGNLLFYTDGMSIWNRNHVVMANGSGLTGNFSSTQSALIVQKPGSSNLYYVFVTFTNLRYSVVDMSLNGGLGEVVANSKNTLLYSNAGEKICGVPHANGTDVWVMSHEYSTNGFNAFLISAAGVNNIPVHSNTGISNPNNGAYGQMKFSCKGDKIALGIADQTGPNRSITVAGFDNSTGIVTDGYSIKTIINQTYGLEFSPDGRYLYAAINFALTQYDLNAGLPAAVEASGDTVATSNSYPFNSLQIGPDSKIYIAMAGNSYLGVVANPNQGGTACGVSTTAIWLGGTTVSLGLPSMVNYACAITEILPLALSRSHINPVCHDSCTGSATLNITNGTPPYKVKWATGDTTLAVQNLCGGQYVVTVTDQAGASIADTVVISNALPVTVAITSPRTSICSYDSVFISATPGFSAYTWNVPGADSIIKARQAGSYYVTVADTSGCKTESNHLSIAVNQPPQVVLPILNTICAGDSAELCAGGNYTTYRWNNNQTSSCITVKNAGNYYLTVTDTNNCVAESNHVPLAVFPIPSVSIIVKSDTLTSFGAVAYQWYYNSQPIEGATANTHVADSAGNYSVEITDANGCKALSSPVFVDLSVTGIGELQEGAIHVYPNPSTGHWNLSIDMKYTGARLEIYNTSGQLVYTGIVNGPQSAIELNTAPGIYMLRMVAGKNVVAIKKVVKIE